MNKKNCLVLGATGQDGSLLCKSLINQGFQVFGISRKNIQDCSNHIKLGINNDVIFTQINPLNIDEINQMKDEDINNLLDVVAESLPNIRYITETEIDRTIH